MQDGTVRVQLYSNAFSGPIELTELHGREAIGELFNFDLGFTEPDGQDLELDRLIDPRARVALLFVREGELLRAIFGRLVTARKHFTADKQHAQIQAQFVPRAWSTTLHERTEAYVGRAPDVIAKVMQRALLAPDTDYELRLTTEYPEREFVLQYHETDLGFLTRICEHWGIYFFFEHGKRDRLVFCDDNSGIQDVATSPEEPADAQADDAPANPKGDDETVVRFTTFQESSVGQRLAVQTFGSQARALPSSFGTHDYNYRTPTVSLQAQADVSGTGDGLLIEYGLHFKTPDEGQFLATRRAQALLATKLTHDGSSNIPAFRSGGTLRMEEHPAQDFDLLITEVVHEVSESGYTNRFRAQPKAVVYRHAVEAPRPRVAGLATGIVVGTSATDPMIDDEGRYEISLLFDAVDPGETRASRPIRMMQPHTGPDYGMHFPLKPGTEVAIGFVNGDPDRPLIVGSVPNPITPSPVRGSRQNTSRNVLKSVSGVFIEMDDDA